MERIRERVKKLEVGEREREDEAEKGNRREGEVLTNKIKKLERRLDRREK